MHNYINRSSEVRNYRPDSKVMNQIEEQQHQEQSALDGLTTAMTDTPTPGSHNDHSERCWRAAHHLRTYAEQIEIQERKSSLESECLQGQLTDRDARIKELEISNHNWEVHGKRLHAQVKELEACCVTLLRTRHDH